MGDAPLISFLAINGPTSPQLTSRLASIDSLPADRVEVLEISTAADGAALVAQARGRYISFLEEGVWAPDVIAHLERTANEHPHAVVVYTDEEISGVREHKPALLPERLRTQDYLGAAVFFSREFVEKVTAVSPASSNVIRYELLLAAVRDGGESVHLVEALWASAALPDLTHDELGATKKILERHLSLTGGGEVVDVLPTRTHDTRRRVDGAPLVSIVIPSRGSHGVVRGVDRCMVIEAVRSIVELSTYDNYEVVIVLDDVANDEVERQLASIAGDRLRLVPWSKPFSFSGKVNLGVVTSRGEYVVLLNDDIEVISPGWMEALLALTQRPGVGMTGAFLFYDDGTIQHGGHHYFRAGIMERGDASHIGVLMPGDWPGPYDGMLVEREAAGVTAACAMLAKSTFLEVGGLSPLLPGNFNDVDLSMKVRSVGYEILWTPHARLFHFESKTRNSTVAEYEVHVVWGRWGNLIDDRRFWPHEPESLDEESARV